MGSELVVEAVRKFGTEETIRATVEGIPAEEGVMKNARMIGRIMKILESKFGLRRGHVVSVVCAAQGIESD